jgi:hypothetical protein
MSLGRVKPAPVALGRVQPDGTVRPERSICEVAADARARNSPAAAGLERQCAQTSMQTPATDVPQAATAETEGKSGDVRLSRIFTGGAASGSWPGQTGDFVELRNRGQTPLDLSGWSLQYTSAQGSSWQVIRLSGIIAPDQIFLVAAGGLVKVQPDLAAPVQLGADSGKLALVRSARALQGSCPTDSADLVDFVGYGAANCSLGHAMSGGAVNAAFSRAQDGCSDTRDNAVDFAVGPPLALDRARAIEPCPPQ